MSVSGWETECYFSVFNKFFVVLLEWFHVKHGGVGWFAGWLFESVVSPLWVARDWSGSFNCMFHVKHQSSQQLVGEGRHTQSHPQQLNHQPTTFHVNNRNYKITKGKLKIAVWETHLPLPAIPTISVSRETSGSYQTLKLIQLLGKHGSVGGW